MKENNTTKTLKCGCSCDPDGNTRGANYQDRLYGKDYRLCNRLPPKDKKVGTGGWRCTVCGMNQI